MFASNVKKWVYIFSLRGLLHLSFHKFVLNTYLIQSLLLLWVTCLCTFGWHLCEMQLSRLFILISGGSRISQSGVRQHKRWRHQPIILTSPKKCLKIDQGDATSGSTNGVLETKFHTRTIRDPGSIWKGVEGKLSWKLNKMKKAQKGYNSCTTVAYRKRHKIHFVHPAGRALTSDWFVNSSSIVNEKKN